jgi:hypothetical protein
VGQQKRFTWLAQMAKTTTRWRWERCRRSRLPENSGEVLLGQPLSTSTFSFLFTSVIPLDTDRGSCIFPGSLLEAEFSHKNGGQP